MLNMVYFYLAVVMSKGGNKMNNDINFNKYTHEAAKKAFQGKPLSDESVDNAILEMRGKFANGDVAREAYQTNQRGTLSLVKEIMRLNITRLRLRKKRIARISFLLTSFLLLLSLSIGVFVYKDYAWKSVLKYTEVRMDSLEIIPIKSLEEYNTSKSAHFYWLDNVEKSETYAYYNEDKPVMFSESYLYGDNLNISLFILNKYSSIDTLSWNYINVHTIKIKNIRMKYVIESDEIFGVFNRYYDYYFKIGTTETSVLEPILSNLTKN